MNTNLINLIGFICLIAGMVNGAKEVLLQFHNVLDHDNEKSVSLPVCWNANRETASK